MAEIATSATLREPAGPEVITPCSGYVAMTDENVILSVDCPDKDMAYMGYALGSVPYKAHFLRFDR